MPRVACFSDPAVTVRSELPASGMDDIGFYAWLSRAGPGDMFIYHQGFLAIDADALNSRISDDYKHILQHVAAAARQAANRGLVHLVQKRLGPDKFAYIAIARPRPGASSNSLLKLLREEEAA